MIHIESEFPFQQDLLERAANTALEYSGETLDSELTIVLTNDARLQELNRDYLGIDAPTDVLSFPASETDPETGARYLGDILISVARARDQAERPEAEPDGPASLDATIRLLENRRYGDHRGPLCLALAKTKDARAAGVIASVGPFVQAAEANAASVGIQPGETAFTVIPCGASSIAHDRVSPSCAPLADT